VGANYRASQRAKSTAVFINKFKIVEEEWDETLYFIEILIELKKEDEIILKSIHSEGSEILAIIVKSIRTARTNAHTS